MPSYCTEKAVYKLEWKWEVTCCFINNHILKCCLLKSETVKSKLSWCLKSIFESWLGGRDISYRLLGWEEVRGNLRLHICVCVFVCLCVREREWERERERERERVRCVQVLKREKNCKCESECQSQKCALSISLSPSLFMPLYFRVCVCVCVFCGMCVWCALRLEDWGRSDKTLK